MARAWTAALAILLAVAFIGCAPKEKPDAAAKKGGTVEVRVPVTEKKPTPPEPKEPGVEIRVPKPEVKPTPPKPDVPKAVTVKLKRGIGIDLTKLLNNDGITDDTDLKDSDFDQWNQSYPADELPEAGNLCLKELPCCFVFPTKEAKKKNNVACAGQSIPLAGKAKALHLLVSATDGNQESTINIAYADGNVANDLKVTDWCVAAAFGEKVACATKNRIAVDTQGQGIMSKEAKATHIWCVTIPLDAKRELKAAKLPYNAQIHIFAMTLTQ